MGKFKTMRQYYFALAKDARKAGDYTSMFYYLSRYYAADKTAPFVVG